MEENPVSACSAHRRPWAWLLVLLVLPLSLAACFGTPAGAGDPTRPPLPPAVNAVILPTAADTRPPDPTRLPIISFRGVEFGYDEATFGPLRTRAQHPARAGQSGPLQPEHLQFSMAAVEDFDTPQLLIYPVAQYRALSDEAAAQIDALQTLLRDQPADPAGPLPLLPLLDAVTSFHTAPAYLDFRNGRGLGYVVRADHDHSLQTAETVYYTFQGLTDNGDYLITAFFPLAGEDLESETLIQLQSTGTTTAAKPANEAKWSGLPAGAGVPDVEAMLSTLLITPDETFSADLPPAYAHTPGVLLAYDPALSGAAQISREPAMAAADDGAMAFLPGVPDMIAIHYAEDDSAALAIQPLRDGDGAFFAAIPPWQREEVAALEAALLRGGDGEQTAVSFPTGAGLRHVTGGAAGQVYHFRGLAADGRYLLRFQQTLRDGLTPAALDQMLGTLVVEPEASTESSVPPEQGACVHDAVFEANVTMPDDTTVERGETFVKIWRVHNSGTCVWTPATSIDFAEGNPLTWEPLPLTAVVLPGESAEVGITAVSPETPALYQTSFQLHDEGGQAFGAPLLLRFEAPHPATDIPGYGVVEGAINYPAAVNPPLDIYIQTLDGRERFAMRTEQGWTAFANTVPAGTYHVFARVAGDESGSGGGYTQAVICGLHASCDDHSLIEVEVREGKASKNIDILDWYAPAGSFPFPPPG